MFTLLNANFNFSKHPRLVATLTSSDLNHKSLLVLEFLDNPSKREAVCNAEHFRSIFNIEPPSSNQVLNNSEPIPSKKMQHTQVFSLML